MGAVEQLVGLLSMEHRPFHEQLIVALYHLVADNERAQAECHRPEFALRSLLLDRKHSLEQKEEFQVCFDYSSFSRYVHAQMSTEICCILKWFDVIYALCWNSCLYPIVDLCTRKS